MASDMDNDDGPMELRAEPRPVPPRFRKSRMWVAGVALIAFLLFSWYAYKQATKTGEQAVAPLIAADQQPTRAKPEEPGGMEIPHQDKSIYDRMGTQEPAPKVETMLPPPATPMARPSASGTPGPEGATSGGAASEAQTGAPSTGAPPSPPAEAAATTPPSPAPSYTAPTVTSPPASAETTTQTMAQTAAKTEAAPPAAKSEMKPPAKSAPAKSMEKPKQTAAATTPGAAAPKAVESGAYRVQLSSLRSEAAADKEWKRLKAKYSDLLGNLTLKVERADLGSKGVYYRVQAGALSESAAKTLCAELKKRSAGCLVVKP